MRRARNRPVRHDHRPESKGQRPFGGGAMAGASKLRHSQVSTTGVLMATYERAGEIVAGSFALDGNG